jgi:tetratricopeptide (TPR) repeat protein
MDYSQEAREALLARDWNRLLAVTERWRHEEPETGVAAFCRALALLMSHRVMHWVREEAHLKGSVQRIEDQVSAWLDECFRGGQTQDGMAPIARSCLFGLLDRVEEQGRELERATQQHPEDADAWLWLGLYYSGCGDAGRGRECIEHARRLRPDHAGTLYHLAVRSKSEPKTEEALYRQAIAADPHFSQAYLDLAALLGAAGRHEEALSLAVRVTEFDAQCGLAFLLAGACCFHLGRQEEARAWYEKARRAEPTRDNLARVERALKVMEANPLDLLYALLIAAPYRYRYAHLGENRTEEGGIVAWLAEQLPEWSKEQIVTSLVKLWENLNKRKRRKLMSGIRLYDFVADLSASAYPDAQRLARTLLAEAIKSYRFMIRYFLYVSLFIVLLFFLGVIISFIEQWLPNLKLSRPLLLSPIVFSVHFFLAIIFLPFLYRGFNRATRKLQALDSSSSASDQRA